MFNIIGGNERRISVENPKHNAYVEQFQSSGRSG